MKKILKYISLLAGVAFLTAACSQSDIDGNASEEMGTLRLSVNIGGSRADAYNALDRSIMRVYKIENGEEKLIRKYQPATEAPGDFYLVAGSYRIKVEAGDQSQATFTNKSYYGELDVDIEPQQTVLKEVVCPTTNITRCVLGTDAQIHRERNGLLPAARRCSQPELGLLQLEHGVG